ncbi:MAG TPA: hypothetical protein VF016_05145 [Nitrososphaera sp.]|jgi:hypothetical protein|nr:hypothetical protein [uncultured Nitrososphaera sp.]
MPVGAKIRQGDLEKVLSSLDLDEGVRIESAGKKMFVNKSASGVFVVQVGNEFYYLDSTSQVAKLVDRVFGKKYEAYAY